MKVKLHAGVELDTLTRAELAAELRSWSTELRRGAKLLRRSMTGTVAPDGTLSIGLGEPVGPEASMVWGITRLTLLGGAARPATLVTAANPAAGQNFTATVPAGQMWSVQSVGVQLTTSAVVANRIVELFADDGTNVYFRTSINTTIAASSTRPAVFFPGPANNGSGSLAVPLPINGLVLPAGHRFRTNVVNLDAGDQLSGITYTYSSLSSPAGVVAYANDTNPSSALTPLNPGAQTFDGRALVLQGGERLVIGGTGLLPGDLVTVTAQIREVPANTAWSL